MLIYILFFRLIKPESAGLLACQRIKRNIKIKQILLVVFRTFTLLKFCELLKNVYNKIILLHYYYYYGKNINQWLYIMHT